MTNASLVPRELPFAREIVARLERALNREIAASTTASDLAAELEGRSFAIDVAGLGVRCVLRCVGGRVVLEPSSARAGASLPPPAASATLRAAPAPESAPFASATLRAAPAPESAPFASATLRAAPAPESAPFASATLRAAPAPESAPFASATLRAGPLDLLRLLRVDDIASLRGTGAELTGSPEIAERFAKLLKLARPDLEELASRWLGDVPAHALGRAARGAASWLRRAGEALRMNTAEFLQEESRALPAALEAQAFYADVERLRDDVERAAARLARIENARSR